ncbi:MAG: DUF1847 domain-containing protein [Chloroflexi bacterium]|nr:DUF1847 domain-containing protein [Chloroflexota bacterium]
MAKKLSPMCSRCGVLVCRPEIKVDETPPIETAPVFCPMKLMPDVIDDAMSEYKDDGVKEFARQASIQEFECYEQTPEGKRAKNTRIEETIQLAKKCGFKKLGLAFCAGLPKEASLLTDILENNGFEVVSARCKVGAVPKETIGIRPEQKIRGPRNWESMCNPISQAKIMNAEKVDLAILLGLCVGHDTLFLKYCRVPVTVLAAKDRVTGHSPLAPLYSSYYSRLMSKPRGKENGR